MSEIGKAYEELVAIGEVDTFLASIRKFAEKKLKRVSFAGSETDDIVQEVLIKVYENIEKYDNGRGAASTYFENIINNRIRDLLRHSGTASNLNLVNASTIINDDEDYYSQFEGQDKSCFSIIKTFDNYGYRETVNDLFENLTEKETNIVKMKVAGYTLTDVSHHYKVSLTAIRKSWARIIKKLENIVDMGSV